MSRSYEARLHSWLQKEVDSRTHVPEDRGTLAMLGSTVRPAVGSDDVVTGLSRTLSFSPQVDLSAWGRCVARLTKPCSGVLATGGCS